MLKLPDNKFARFLFTALIYAVILLVFGSAEAGLLWVVGHYFGRTAEHIFGWGLSAVVFGYMAWSTANPRKPKAKDLPLTPFQAQAVADAFKAKGYPAAGEAIEQIYELKPSTPKVDDEAPEGVEF